ncbi:DNA-methyltransferase [Mordavella massiliensis]|nr:DNA methyltransferase [Mordavella massiliensis]
MISLHPRIYKLFNEDCREVMLRFPPHSIDLILADPPYNISQYSSGNILRVGKSMLNNDIAEWDKVIIKPAEYLDVFKRLIKPTGNIIIFSGYNQIGECPICSYPERLKNPYHPTQKPLQLIEHFVKIASNPGSIVFDPFMGVGSTGVAAVKNGRRFIGCDINKAYVLASQERMESIINVAHKPLP